jgi:anti-sigma regulatory factor (Ser/Thr protein kinase)
MSSLGGLGWALGDAMIVASELVTKTVRHTNCPRNHWIHVEVARSQDAISIEVSDPSYTRPDPVSQNPREVGLDGLALLIVEQLARRWGADNEQGYRIWAEVALDARA